MNRKASGKPFAETVKIPEKHFNFQKMRTQFLIQFEENSAATITLRRILPYVNSKIEVKIFFDEPNETM
jgi:hypothetical protein